MSEGVVVSPSIDLTGAGGAVTLTFNYLLQTEGQTNFDRALVEVSTNNGASYLLLALTNNTGGLWHQATIDLSAFAGWPVRLRFHFDTVDGAVNSFEGWYVDDIVISSSLVAVPISPVISGNFIDGVWTGSISVQQAVSGMILKADDGLAHTGTSNPFDVVVPSLSIARMGHDTVISWPTTLSELTLRSTTNLEPVTTWNVVTNTPVNAGNWLTVTNTLGGPQQFYRLER